MNPSNYEQTNYQLVESSDIAPNSQYLTPKQIVAELNRYIVGQDDAKKLMAIALRNRFRRKMVPHPLAEEIIPKNILMIGPTGVGKTEIARRLAKIADAPFVKVEATKFTEVGYVGRDVDSIIRDLVEIAIKDLKKQAKKQVIGKSEQIAKKIILKQLIGSDASAETQEKFSQMLEKGQLNHKEIEIDVMDHGQNPVNSFDIPGGQIGMISIGDMIGKALGNEKTKKVKTTIAEALEILTEQESEKLIDIDKITRNALKSVENDGIVFIDEIDKICRSNHNVKGGDVSREGVQRDLLPLVEGTAINTKYGIVKTDHILFIASGAFHICKPSDLLPELQGRFPIRVQLKALTEADFIAILTEPENNLIRQYRALLATEKLLVNFTTEGIAKIASIAFKINNEVENIGARRLHTILEKTIEDLSFNASEMANVTVNIDEAFVSKNVEELLQNNQDLAKFVL